MLEDAFTFTAEELELNRSGQLSEAQEVRLDGYREMRGCGRRAALIAFGLTALILFVVPFLLANRPGMADARGYIWGVAVLFIVIVVIFAVMDSYTGQDLTQGKLSVMEGEVKTWSKEIGAKSSSVGTTYYLMVGLKQFQLSSEEQMNALHNEESYRFFYIENGRLPIIFSVERLTQSDS